MLVILADEGPVVLNTLQAFAFTLEDATDPIGKKVQEEVREILISANTFCERLHLRGCGGRIRVFRDDILDGVSCTRDVVYNECFGLSQSIVNELAERKLVFVRPDLVQYLEQDNLFGRDVEKCFSEAKDDIRDAGNCLAAGLHTAAVFHLMRVAEMGLRRFATKWLRAPVINTINFMTWKQILDAIDVKLKELKGKSRVLEEKRKLYAAIALDIQAFRELWRNPVMHCRSRYGESQAINALTHVRRFMETLSTGGKKSS
jgi:hypothetical protein